MGDKRYRYQPKSESQPLNVEAHPRCLRLLFHLGRYKFLCADQLACLIWLDEEQGRLEKYTKGARKYEDRIHLTGIQNNLNRLWNGGYLVKRFQQAVRIHQGSGKDVYALSARGAEALATSLGFYPEEVKYPPMPSKYKAHSGMPADEDRLLKHNLGISSVVLGFELASHFTGGEFLYFALDKALKVEFKHQGKQTKIFPDGLIILETPQRERLHFFLEVDRGTEKHSQIKSKLRAYHAFSIKKNYQEFLLDLYQTESKVLKPKELSGKSHQSQLNHFGLLFITRSKGRMERLIETTQATLHEGRGVGWLHFSLLKHFQFSKRKFHISVSGREYSKLEVTPHQGKIVLENIWVSGLKSQPDPCELKLGQGLEKDTKNE